ncbi:MAG: ABC transporter permease [Acidobacteria bacterium]|nr:ABC transporter permease [Acidobacteriota bacterium]
MSTIASQQHAAVRRDRRVTTIGALMVFLGALMAVVFGLIVPSGAHSQLTFTPLNTAVHAPWHLGALTLDTRWSDTVLGLMAIGLGVDVIVRQPRRALSRFGLTSVLFLLALLLWTSRTGGPAQTNFVNVTTVLIGSSSLVMVLIYGSLSGVMCERAGVVNIAIEGQFIAGAFLGSMIESTTNSFWLATLAGALAGALLGWVLAFLALRYMSDQIIVGVVIVTLLSALSSYLNLQILTPYPQFNLGNPAPNVAIPFLYKIPVLGPVLFNQTGFFYLAVALIALISFGLFRTRWGLRVRAVGEHPKAAESVGINVVATRYRNVILGGAIAGIGGVAFMATQGPFQPGYTSGLGYIALAALIFGRWTPSGAVVASVLFGILDYLSYNLQNYSFPLSTEILGMFPYLITIAVVAGLIGRVRPPAADGIPYQRS